MGANKPNMEFFDFAPAPAGFKWVRDKENGEGKLIQTDDGMSRGEIAHHISKRTTQQTVKDKTKYSRKTKHKGNEQE